MPDVIVTELLEEDPPVDSDAWLALLKEASEELQLAQTATLGTPTAHRRSARRGAADNEGHSHYMRAGATPLGRRYMTEGVTTVPGQTFGIEIEFMGGDPTAIAHDLYLRGLVAYDGMAGYHSDQRTPGKWILERDVSVNGEIVSPVLTDTPQTWKDLATICEVVRRHGGYVDASTGAHVHVGVKSSGLEHTVRDVRTVVALTRWSEDLLYRLSSGSVAPFHRGSFNGYNYCGRMNERTFERQQVANTLEADVELMGSHHAGLNLGNLTNNVASRTIEFRHNDCILDPERLQANILVDCAIMAAATHLDLADVPTVPHPLGYYAEQHTSGEDLLEEFCDVVLSTPEQKLKVCSVFERTKWQDFQGGNQAVALIRDAVIPREMERIQEWAQANRVRLRDGDLEWLIQFVDWREAAPSPDDATTAARQAALAWSRQPLERDAYNVTRRTQVRSKRALALLSAPELAELGKALVDRAQEKRIVLSPLEVRWCTAVASPQDVSFALLAPTRRTEELFLRWMREPRVRGRGLDVRDSTTLDDRLGRYEFLTPYSTLRNTITDTVAQALGTPLSDAAQDAIRRVVRKDLKFSLEAIPAPREWAALLAALEPKREGTHLGALVSEYGQAAAGCEIMLGSMTREGRTATDLETSWVQEAVMAETQAQAVALAASEIPSVRCATAYLEWRHALPADQMGKRWNAERANFDSVVQRSIDRDIYPRASQQDARDAVKAFRRTLGRAPTATEQEWMVARLGREDTSYAEAPTTEVRQCLIGYLATPVAGDLPFRSQWQHQRDATRRSAVFETMCLSVDDEVARGDARSGAQVAPPDTDWVHEWLVSHGTKEPTSVAQGVLATNILASRVGRLDTLSADERELWQDISHGWDSIRRTALVHARASDEVAALRQSSGSVSGYDSDWLTAMMGGEVPSEGMPQWDVAPAYAAWRQLVAQTGVAPTDFDGTAAPWVSEIYVGNWERWRERQVTVVAKEQLVAMLVESGSDPDGARAWADRISGCVASSDALPPREADMLTTAAWMVHSPQGDPVTVAAFAEKRDAQWAAACMEISGAHRTWHPLGDGRRWRVARKQAANALAQPDAPEGQGPEPLPASPWESHSQNRSAAAGTSTREQPLPLPQAPGLQREMALHGPDVS